MSRFPATSAVAAQLAGRIARDPTRTAITTAIRQSPLRRARDVPITLSPGSGGPIVRLRQLNGEERYQAGSARTCSRSPRERWGSQVSQTIVASSRR